MVYNNVQSIVNVLDNQTDNNLIRSLENIFFGINKYFYKKRFEFAKE